MDLSGSGQGQVSGSCEHSNENSDCMICAQYLDQLRNYKFLKKDSTPQH